MSFSGTPVKIPEVPRKITLREYNGRTYVAYEIGRSYNSARKNTNPQRKNIGLQIRNAPTMMLPNENYEIYFANGAGKMNDLENEASMEYEAIRKEFRMLSSLFDQLYFDKKTRRPFILQASGRVAQIGLEPMTLRV